VLPRVSYAGAFLTLEAFSYSAGRRKGRWIAISHPLPPLWARHTLAVLLCYRLVAGNEASCETDVRGDVEDFHQEAFLTIFFVLEVERAMFPARFWL